MKTIILPVGQRVLVQIDQPPAYTGRLHVPSQFLEQPSTGRVRAIGSRAKTELKTDDRVQFAAAAGTSLTVEGRAFRLLDVSEVLAKVGCTICGDDDHAGEHCPHLD